MEKQIKKSIKEFVIPFAIFAGIGRVFIDFIPKILAAGPIIYYSTFLICFLIEILLIVYLIKKYRFQNNDSLSLKESLIIGVTLMVIMGSLYGISSYMYDTFIDPDFQINTAIAWGELFGQGEAVKTQIEQNPPNKSSIFGIFFTVLWFSFLGFIISMISGNILKKESKY